MPRRLIVISNWGCEDVFKGNFDQIIYDDLPKDFGPQDALLLEGGVDINPAIYGEARIKECQHPSRLRDETEIRYFRAAQLAGASVIGICRGAQLICALAGGRLIQHVTNHDNHRLGHFIQQSSSTGGDTKWCTSLHHQMMFPYDLAHKTEYDLLSWSLHNISTTYKTPKGDMKDELAQDFKEPEIVWFPKVRGLAIQGHPEYQPEGAQFRNHCRDLVKEFCKDA